MKVKIKTERAAIAGRMRGKTTNQKILISLTPSTRAASTNSNGNNLIKLRINKMQNPV